MASFNRNYSTSVNGWRVAIMGLFLCARANFYQCTASDGRKICKSRCRYSYVPHSRSVWAQIKWPLFSCRCSHNYSRAFLSPYSEREKCAAADIAGGVYLVSSRFKPLLIKSPALHCRGHIQSVGRVHICRWSVGHKLLWTRPLADC